MNVYKACDKAISATNRENVEAFGRLKLAKWDEVSVIRTVKTVYRSSARRARKRYYEVGFEAYLLAMAMCGVPPKKAHQMAENAIDEEWVDGILTQTDFVTLYRFDSEMERKALRLAEALEVAENRNAEIDKALRYWSDQLGQYFINVTDYAVIQAYEDAGILLAEWETADDEKVCRECHALGGQVFRIDEVPPKPHRGCRCRFRPVFRSTED